MTGGRGIAGIWFGGNFLFIGTVIAIFDVARLASVLAGLTLALIGLIVFVRSARGRF